ncbi:serine/threonine-protein kinase [Nonomuraea sp. B12E4]|uniref:serine/threonine-protein kinase n=1 Tax=Nonomuraea sp. B12E4 TaxID=3153564 RepID=UPI00325F316E
MLTLEPDDPRSIEAAGGRYRVLARIGSGGMGVVYLGRSAGGRTVAIKTVHVEFAEDAEFRARFRREVEVARLVGGGFTAPLIDADPDAAIPWLVTEYLPSVSLREAVGDLGALPAGAVRPVAAGIAEALVSIHRAGVVHRDLKPANVLLTADGPRVIDFGIARAVDAATVTRPGSQAGSPGFMSPEQVEGAPAGPAGDVFSFGSTLAYACTGAEPFGEAPWHVTMFRIQHESPRLDGIADEKLRSVIASCMERDPSRRPTAEELAERLSAMSRHGGHASWPPPPVLAEIVRRRNEAENPPAVPDLAPATAPGRGRAFWYVAVAVAVVGLAVALWTATRPEPQAPPPDPLALPTFPPTPPEVTPAASPPEGETRELRFSLTGDVRLTSLTYTVNNEPTTLKNVKLPWRKVIELPGWPPRSSWRLTYRFPPGEVSHMVEAGGQAVSTRTSSDTSRSTTIHEDGTW